MASTRSPRSRRTLAPLTVAAMLASLIPVLSIATSAPAEAATFTALKVQPVNARSSGTAVKDAAIPSDVGYKWLITGDDIGNPDQPIAQCQAGAAGYPDSCKLPSVRTTDGSVPILAQGTQADLGPATALTALPAGHYLISLLADGYALGGKHFTMPLTGGTNGVSATGVLSVPVQPGPIPLGTLRVRVFHDIAPVDATYETGGVEDSSGCVTNSAGVVTNNSGPNCLAGFTAHLSDVFNEVTTDWYGNPLCTTYKHSAADATHPDGQVLFYSSPPLAADDPKVGLPVVATLGAGCKSDANGDIVIPNLGSNRYGVLVNKPTVKSTWVQTTTLEGAHDHDVWVQANDTGLDTEIVVGGEPVPYVQFGFVQPQPTVRTPGGHAHVTGQILAGLTYVGGNGGITIPGGTGTAGGKEGPPIDRPWISLSDLGNGDQMIYTARGTSTGTFDIANVPDGSYQLTAWDDDQDYIIFSFNVTVKGGVNVDTGKNYLSGWATHIYGTVFIDTNENGIRDPGEQGVAGTALTVRERDNSLLDQFTNTATTNDAGEYDIKEAYPLAKWVILEHFNTRYYTTGATIQNENDPSPTTYLGAAVDLNLLPVLGLGTRVDWGVKPYAPGTNGGIVGTVSYDTTRNELDPAYAVSEGYQPGIPGVGVDLYAVVRDTDPSSPTYGQPLTNPDGSLQKGPKLAATYPSEHWAAPKNCTARQWNGSVLTGLTFIPTAGPDQTCVESPAMGTQVAPSDNGPDGFSQTVNGNYGFGTSQLNLVDPNNPDNTPVIGSQGEVVPLYDSLAAHGLPDQPLLPDDYIVSVDIPTDPVDHKPMYQVTKEEDVNVFTGDAYLPQENFPLSGDPTTNPPDPGGGNTTPPEAPPSQGGGLGISPCVGPNHVVDVTNPDFAGGGGSPYQGQDRPLCTDKLVTVRSQQAVAPNFNLFTPVPLPTHFWGLTINDLGLSWDPKSIQYGEAQGLPGVPMGIYDFSGNLVDTVKTDYNGFYEAIEPSTSSYNCPLPAGPCPGMYRFVGNDPGQPGAPNVNYNPRFRTIATNFQAWPGLFTVTDTAPTQTGAVIVTPGTTTPAPVTCDVSSTTPEVFATNKVVVASTTTAAGRTVTVTGRGFGAGGNANDLVELDRQDGSVAFTASTAPGVSAWSDTSVSFVLPTTTTGPLQLRVRGASGAWASSAITIHETAALAYNPAVFDVGPGQTFTTIQSAISYNIPLTSVANLLLRGRELAFGRVVVVHPGATSSFNPLGAYLENPIMNKQVKLQGFGPGGVYADGTQVRGSVIDGQAYDADGASGTTWTALANGPHAGPAGVPDGAVVTVLPASTNQFTSSTTSATYAAVDGFRITGGYQQDVAGNLNAITGANHTGFGATGAGVTQGGGIYVHAYARNLHLTNNLVIGNSGSYAGGIRVGTPYASTSDNQNDNVRISFNRIRDNGGTNLAGGVGLFTGTQGYRFDHNDVCGNFSAEYGAGLSVFGLSPSGTVSANRFWFNESYDEGAGIFIAGELPANPDALSPGTGDQTVTGNEIDANTANDDGGGLRLMSTNRASITVTNNMIVDNVSTHEGGGVALDDAANVAFVNNTVARNITTATAVTSDGSAAAAGLSTGKHSVQLMATLPAGSPDYSKPTLLNDIFWENKAGTWNGSAVLGIGITGTPGPENFWDIGSTDGSAPLQPRFSILTTPNAGQTTAPDVVGGVNVVHGTDVPLTGNTFGDVITSGNGLVNFRSPYQVTVEISTLRTFPGFRQAVIVVNNVPPDQQGSYHLASTGASAAANLGVSWRNYGTTLTPAFVFAPTVDIDYTVHVDTPAAPNNRYTRPVTVTPATSVIRIEAGADER